MSTDNIDLGAGFALAGAVVLVIAMSMLSWYSIDDVTVTAAGQSQTISADDVPTDAADDASAFQAFSVIDYLLLACVAVTIGAVLTRAMDRDTFDRAGAIVTGTGVVALALVLFRVLAVPDFSGRFSGVIPPGVDIAVGVNREIGCIVALAAAAALSFGGSLIRSR